MAKPRSRHRGVATPGVATPGVATPGVATPGVAAPRTSDAQTEEAHLFRAAVRDVTPLAIAAQPPKAAALPRPRVRRRAPIVEFEAMGVTTPGAAALGHVEAADDAANTALPGAADALSFRRPGVRDQTLRQLKRGRYPVEDELDLHGLNQAAARDYLANFIAASRHAGLRCVRIVHGKGYRSGARGPVLKIAVNAWLRRHADVLAFASARVIDGGTGAVYVLLR
jgi:DNA-nicking Smr family endonuclease